MTGVCLYWLLIQTRDLIKMIKNGTCLADVSEADSVVSAVDGEDGSR